MKRFFFISIITTSFFCLSYGGSLKWDDNTDNKEKYLIISEKINNILVKYIKIKAEDSYSKQTKTAELYFTEDVHQESTQSESTGSDSTQSEPTHCNDYLKKLIQQDLKIKFSTDGKLHMDQKGNFSSTHTYDGNDYSITYKVIMGDKKWEYIITIKEG